MARIKIEGYAKEWQMYQCDKTDTDICKNCRHWQYSDALPTIRSCELDMDSISPYMSCDKFKRNH